MSKTAIGKRHAVLAGWVVAGLLLGAQILLGQEEVAGRPKRLKDYGLPGLEQKVTRAPIKNEADNGLSNLRGTIAMARTQVVDSATSQFFINLKDNAFLDHRGKMPSTYGYAVFGKVTEGMEVVDAIAAEKTTATGARFQNLPVKTVKILSINKISAD